MHSWRPGTVQALVTACFLTALTTTTIRAQQPDAAAVIHGIDAAVQARFDSIAEFTVTEHYAVYRGKDAAKPMAEMTVKTLYKRDEGKSYTILSQSGPDIVKKMVFSSLLDNEKHINDPVTREASWFISANYEMKLKPGGTQLLNDRECFVLDITPKHKAPNLIVGTMWVDAKDESLVKIEGIGSKSPSIWAGPTQMLRQYVNINGFAMATHARAVSSSFLFGQTVVTIDYADYHIQLRSAK